MSQEKLYPPPPGYAARALINASTYESMYRDSVQNTDAFWAKHARERLDWIKPFTKVKDTSFDVNDLHVRWFADGQLNVSANCLDRHLMKRADQTADRPASERRAHKRDGDRWGYSAVSREVAILPQRPDPTTAITRRAWPSADEWPM